MWRLYVAQTISYYCGMLKTAQLSLDHDALLNTLADSDRLLLIQDLDGVCMGLVRDPLTRSLERAYIEAGRALAGRFYVLTNGEHIGTRGVNSLVEAAFDDPAHAREQGLYLPGLAGGGVQLQDAFGNVSHPGVTAAELDFLARVPGRARAALVATLAGSPYSLTREEIAELAHSCILDNAVSPTLNLNALYERYAQRPDQYRALQTFAERFMRGMLEEAVAEGLVDAFYLHLAPNLGRDEHGERVRLSDGSDAGTTDFQFMLTGAIKEVGVLVLLNHYVHSRTGHYPLGPDFNAREAPSQQEELLALAERYFDPFDMPQIIGVGDTVTSHPDDEPEQYLRGGSDRGFLTLVQALGERFGTDNATVFIDSSSGEVKRPGVLIDTLHSDRGIDWSALSGISDPRDPLRLNFLFPQGHPEYISFFCALAQRITGLP